MNIKKLNEAIEDVLKQATDVLNEEKLYESPVTKANSIGNYGENDLFNEPADINTIIDKCIEIFQKRPDSKGYAEVKDLNLDCEFPLNDIHINKPVTIIYGNLKLGVRHIIDRHGIEFNSDSDVGQFLCEEDVIKALKDLPLYNIVLNFLGEIFSKIYKRHFANYWICHYYIFDKAFEDYLR